MKILIFNFVLFICISFFGCSSFKSAFFNSPEVLLKNDFDGNGIPDSVTQYSNGVPTVSVMLPDMIFLQCYTEYRNGAPYRMIEDADEVVFDPPRDPLAIYEFRLRGLLSGFNAARREARRYGGETAA